jgi:hypothetical protein
LTVMGAMTLWLWLLLTCPWPWLWIQRAVKCDKPHHILALRHGKKDILLLRDPAAPRSDSSLYNMPASKLRLLCPVISSLGISTTTHLPRRLSRHAAFRREAGYYELQ